MDPRRIELNRRHSQEMGLLFAEFLETHPDIDAELSDAMTDDEDAAWTAFSAQLLARHQAERAALADQIEAEQRAGRRPADDARPSPQNADQAISLASDWIRACGIDYPTEGLAADRFASGWTVYAPVEVDESDPMSFLDIPVGRSVFLVGDSGRVEEVSSSMPPQLAYDRFTLQERAAQSTHQESDAAMAEFERQFDITSAEPAHRGATIAITYVGGAVAFPDTTELLSEIFQQLGGLGPIGWEEFTAAFALTATSEVAQLQFRSEDRTDLVPVPQPIADVVRRHREETSTVPAGPWWRLVLTCTNSGDATVDYDYGDEPFPDGQLVADEHYRNDVQTYPRNRLPIWLAGYIAGPDAQGRSARQAATALTEDAEVGRHSIATGDVPSLHELWARWAVLSAIRAGTGAESGPQMHPGYASYETGGRNGATLFVLPGDRAVLSGGRWNSELLDAAYNRGQQLPDLYTGAPAWVTDSVIDARNRDGLLTFCFWWLDGRWRRGATDTSGELNAAMPPVLTAGETIRAIVEQIGADVEIQCAALLSGAVDRIATATQVAAVFAGRPDVDVDAAVNQLSLAGLLTV